MADYPKNEFTLWFNVIPSQEKPGQHWAVSEIPVDQLEKLYNWALKQNPVQNMRGEPCVKLRANLIPRTAESSGREYLKLAISEQRPKAETDLF